MQHCWTLIFKHERCSSPYRPGCPTDEAEEDAGPGGGGGRRVAAAASLSSKHVGSALHRLLHATWPPSCATAVMEALRGTPM